MPPRVITDNKTLAENYDSLVAGDMVVGRLRLSRGEEHVLLDLTTRGVVLVPSALAQLCSRSKVFQARLLRKYMVPGTEPVYSMHDMLRVLSDYGREKVGKVVCKLDRANGGLGVLMYASVEDVYSQAVLGSLQFPFVVQPFVPENTDIRVVILGDYVEAYARHNPDNFRHNLHCGGKSRPWKIDNSQLALCQEIMARAGFPYAGIDLMVTTGGSVWLNEINLRGGLRGASISQEDYLKAVAEIHSRFIDRETGKAD